MESSWPKIKREWPDWEDLTEAEREAAEALGLDEDEWPPKQDLFVREWVELEGEQQAAALTLGYTPELWPTISRDWPDWEDLNEEEQEAAEVLGLGEHAWPPEDPDGDWSAEDLFSWEALPRRLLRPRHPAPRCPASSATGGSAFPN